MDNQDYLPEEEQTTDKDSIQHKISVWLPLMLALAMAGGVWIGFQLRGQARAAYVIDTNNMNHGMPVSSGKVEEILRFIDARYLEGVDMHGLEEAAVVAMLKKLDPHSSYIPAEELQEVNESLAGGFEGIGVEFYVMDDTIQVVGVVPDGPAAKAGVEVGDKIVMIGDTVVAGIGIKNKDIIGKLKGKGGTTVKIQVKRWNSPDLKIFDIVRAEIPMRSVDVAYMLNEQTGYIKINRFSGKTADEFLEALHKMVSEKGLQDLVIDLRHNPGGYLNAATEILNELFSTKTRLVYTEGRSYKRNDHFSDGKPHFKVNKVAILIDEGSASASEILAGAIQDNDRGIIVGRRSFGKGLVQEQYDLSDGSALRLTVARYYTPSGRLIQRPYDPANDNAEYENDLTARFESGELYHRDSIKITDSTKYMTTGGRVVYGGGGIIPDVFVPLDTFSKNHYFNVLQSYIAPFTYKYIDQNRAALQRYTSIEAFLQQFAEEDKLFAEFVAFAEKEGAKRDESVLKNSKRRLLVYLEAYIAQQLFREEGFYRVLHSDDRVLQSALQELSGKK